MRKYSCSGPTVVKIRCASVSPNSFSAFRRALGERVHRAQQRDLVVQRLARPRHEGGRDAQERAVGVVEDERRRGRVPRGVAAGLEGRADAARRERRRVGLALDELLARELGDRVAVAGRVVEGVVLLGGQAGQRLEPVRVVRRALLHRPLAHRLGDGVGERRVQRRAGLERRLQLLVDVLGQARALLVDREDVGAEGVGAGAGGGQVGGAEGAAVDRPLGGRDVLLTGTHGAGTSSCAYSGPGGHLPSLFLARVRRLVPMSKLR